MTLTDDDYRSLAAQCAIEESGRIDRDGETFYVSMDVDVEYEVEDDYFNGTGAHIPVCAECRVKNFDCDTADGSEADFDEHKLEEMTYDFLMKF